MSPYISDSGAPGREYSKIRDDPAARGTSEIHLKRGMLRGVTLEGEELP